MPGSLLYGSWVVGWWTGDVIEAWRNELASVLMFGGGGGATGLEGGTDQASHCPVRPLSSIEQRSFAGERE